MAIKTRTITETAHRTGRKMEVKQFLCPDCKRYVSVQASIHGPCPRGHVSYTARQEGVGL
jgi:acetone carboxylase gamma subunit